MKLFRIVAAGILLLTVVLTVSGCVGKNFEPLELVPAGSDIIAAVKVSEGFRNWELYNTLEGNSEVTDTITEGKDEFFETTGIDINDVSEVVVFGRFGDTLDTLMETMPSMDPDRFEEIAGSQYFGAIFTGNFVDYDIVANISERTGTIFTEEKSDDFSLYLGDDGKSAILPVNNTMFLLGAPSALKDCILVAMEEKEAVSGAILSTYNGLDDVMVKMAMLVPETTKESFSEMSETDEMMPVGFQSFADMETVGFAAELSTMGLTVTGSMGFPDSAMAADAAEAIQTTIDFLMMMGTDEAAAERVERLDISSSSNTVFINYTFTLAELAEMMETMQDFESMDDFPMVPPMHSDNDSGIVEPDLPDDSDIQ